MRITSLFRRATLALALIAAMGAVSTAAFAAAASQQNSSPYDSDNFVIQSNNVNS